MRPFSLAMPIVHLAYASRARVELSDRAARELLARSRESNAQIGVTGVLLFVERSFFQILEGPPEDIAPLYDRILADKRHTHVVKLIQEPIDARDFADWSMGLAKLTSKELASVPGFNDFFATRGALHELGQGMARKLLTAFREGRWRASVG